MSFLTRTSVLDRMCGPLCDATLGRTGSARVLEQLESRNLLVVPLDRRREWYRYHHLLRELLRRSSAAASPTLVPQLHSRAAAWFEANGMPEAAIEHAQAAGDADRVARLVLDPAQPVWASGRVDTVLRWMTLVRARGGARPLPGDRRARRADLRAARPAGRDRAVGGRRRSRRPRPATLPDGSTMASLLAYLRAILARDGVEAMRRDARTSFDGLSPASPYRATMLHTEGLSYLLDGDPDRADPILAGAFDDARNAGALPLAALVLAERCIVAVDRHDWPGAEALSRRALDIVRGRPLRGVLDERAGLRLRGQGRVAPG